MKKYFENRNEAVATLSNLTSKFPIMRVDKIGFDPKRPEYMFECYKSMAQHDGYNASACGTLIESYNEKFKKVYRVAFTLL